MSNLPTSILIALFTLTVESAAVSTTSHLFTAITGHRKIGVPTTNVTASRTSLCSQLCVLDSACEAFSYSKSARLCQLHDCDGTSSTGTVVEDGDWIFYEPDSGSCPGWPLNCKQYNDFGYNGGDKFYKVKPLKEPFDIYCDMTSNGGGWTRLFYKSGVRSCTNDVTWTTELVEKMGLDAMSQYGVSQDMGTLSTELSWIITDFTLSTSTSYDVVTALTSVFNCKTPTNTDWSDSYAGGHLFFGSGVLSTNGVWTTMWNGCSGTKNVGDTLTIRHGGSSGHVSEFVHTTCGDYNTGNQNSITSRWFESPARSFWMR